MRLPIYSRRREHHYNYGIDITDTGWFWQDNWFSGTCNPKGEPFIYKTLDHESINYPAHFNEYLEHLWLIARQKKWQEKQIQPKLNALGLWVSKTEMFTPKKIWIGFR